MLTPPPGVRVLGVFCITVTVPLGPVVTVIPTLLPLALAVVVLATVPLPVLVVGFPPGTLPLLPSAAVPPPDPADVAVTTLPAALADWGDWVLLEPPAGAAGALLPPPELQDSMRHAYGAAKSNSRKLFINFTIIRGVLSKCSILLSLSAHFARTLVFSSWRGRRTPSLNLLGGCSIV